MRRQSVAKEVDTEVDNAVDSALDSKVDSEVDSEVEEGMLAEEPMDVTDERRRRLAELRAQIKELDARLTVAIRDMMHARRRAEEDCHHERVYGIAELARAILPFKDALETALAIDTEDVPAMRAGLELAHRQLVAVLGRCGR